MRLICPNCGAQYEVSEDAIPEIGRDVQCSNCGHTWFENPGASVAAEEELATAQETSDEYEEDIVGEPYVEEATSDPVFEDDPEVDPEPDASSDETSADDPWDPFDQNKEEPAGDAEAEVEAETLSTEEATTDIEVETDTVQDILDDDAPEAPADDDAPTADPVPQQKLEDSVADILREEASRERSVREAEMPIETQTDMPLDPPMSDRAAEARDRIATLKGEEADANVAAVAALAASSRKEMLPDIEEINSTLRTNAERGENVAPPPEEVEETKKRGFRWGFWGILLLILIAVLVYLFSDQIIGLVPASEGAVTGYVDTVNGARLWVDGRADNVLSSLEADGAEN